MRGEGCFINILQQEMIICDLSNFCFLLFNILITSIPLAFLPVKGDNEWYIPNEKVVKCLAEKLALNPMWKMTLWKQITLLDPDVVTPGPVNAISSQAPTGLSVSW